MCVTLKLCRRTCFSSAFVPDTTNMALEDKLSVLFLLVTFTGVLGGEYCYYWKEPEDGRWCTYGCCGLDSTDCCDADVALIVGLTVMAIIVISTIIAVVCCCVRRRASHGQVINTIPGAGVVVTTTGTTMATTGQTVPYSTQPYQPGMAPQPYATGPPPAHPYGSTVPAYPYGPPAPAPGAMAPPPYPAEGGQENQGFNYKPMN